MSAPRREFRFWPEFLTEQFVCFVLSIAVLVKTHNAELTDRWEDEAGIDAEADERMQKVYYFHQSVAAGQRLTQEGAEVFARYAVQLGHQKQSLRAYKVGRWIAPGIAAAVRAADVLEHSEKQNFYFVFF